jgi:hypothetical protein
MRYMSSTNPNHLFSGHTLWKSNGSILSLVASFFRKSPTWVGVCFPFNRCSFRYHASTFSFMCRFGVGVWLLFHPTTLAFHLSPTHFLTTLHTHLGLQHPMVPHLSRCQCGHTIDDLNTHLLQCPCGSEHIITHDTLWDTIVIIILENGAHVQREFYHLFPCHTQHGMDILITIDDFQTLMDIIIIYSIHIDMVQWSLMTITHAMMMVA